MIKRASSKVKEIEPLVAYVYQKVAEYERPDDTVTVVGSVGNNLYFPEKTEDGYYLMEIDVLYDRSIPEVVLPIESSPKVTVEFITECPDIIIPFGSCCLEVTKMPDEEFDNDDYYQLFNTKVYSGKTYLHSSGYCYLIPRREDPSILGEIEIAGEQNKSEMLPFFRTCATKLKKETLDGKEYSFRVLVDKVAALKAPWHCTWSDFETRNRKWPDQTSVQKIIRDGCLLVYKPSISVRSIQWKITFSLSEQCLTKQFSHNQRYLFVLIKLVKKRYLDLNLLENGESPIGLTSYHLKSIYLWFCESLDQQLFEDSPGTIFKKFFEVLKACIKQMTCPHYFIPRMNIMSGLGRYFQELTERDQAWISENRNLKASLIEKIDEIINKPIEFLTDEILEVVDEKHILDIQKLPSD